MPDPSKQPKPWRCKHCDERVDPTMSLCWNCGYDREGTADPASFIERYENESPICTGCGYDLKGNPDADACPECGTPAPWVECKTCGVRSSRAVMANGCPACRAREAGVAFIPEVVRKVLTHCPRCEYDLRGLVEPANCPECGREIGQGVYDTVTVPAGIAVSDPDPVMLRRRKFWAIALIAMLPLFIVVAELITVLEAMSEGQYTGYLFGGWVLAFVFCIIQFLFTHAALRKQPHADKRPR